MEKIKRALLSVYHKDGLTEFAAGLHELGVELLSTGGTARLLREAGLPVRDVSEATDFPEMLDGRVKTLHPVIHGGILFRRGLREHRETLEKHGIKPIDLVAVNLYPFEETVAREGVTPAEAIEQIDIGGPAMLRSAAKNWESVAAVADPADYAAVLEEMRAGAGALRPETKRRLAQKVFALTSRYDAAVAAYLQAQDERTTPRTVSLHGVLRQELRYGENPHQKAAFYTVPGAAQPSIATAKQLSGKELGFNNILDAAAALELVRELSAPATVVLKHNNPCGAAEDEELVTAFRRAWAGDPLSAFGGIVGFNRPVEAELAEEVASPGRFIEVIVAPSFTKEAAEILRTRPKWGKNVRLIEVGPLKLENGKDERANYFRVIPGGILVQERDRTANDEVRAGKVVTKRAPSAEELEALEFAWKICKHVKSNAVIFAKGRATVGIGAGQMSRVDSVEAAVRKAGARAAGAVMASDAFFPFPDGVEKAAEAGIAAVVQPGGSVKDATVIAACDRLGLAMIFTGRRHFRH